MRRRTAWFLGASFLAGTATAQYGGSAPVGLPALAPVIVTDPAAQSRDLATQIESATRNLEEAQNRVARAEAEISALESRRHDADEALRTRVRALYRMRKASAWPLGGGFQALLSHVSRIEHLERIVLRDVQAQSFLARRGDAVQEELRAARAELSVAELRSKDLDRQRQLLDQQLQIYGYGGIAAFAPSLAVAPGGTPSLGVAQAPGLGAAPVPSITLGGAGPGVPVAPALPVAPVPTLGFPSVGGDSSIGPPSASGFAALRGRLGMPVPSALAVRDAVRDDGPGLEFVAGAGTEARSVADGRIAYSGQYGAYGTLVIIDHGESFYTVYGGLGHVSVRVGDSVARGARIGDVAAGPRPALFFEVRRGTRTLDARNWAGL